MFILFSVAVFAFAEEANQAEPQAVPPPPEIQGKPRFMLDEGYVANLLEKLKQDNPDEAQRLEDLRQENPRLFHVEIRKLAWQYKQPPEGMGPRGAVTPNQEGGPRKLRRKAKGYQKVLEKQTEFISWLEKNEPQIAKELADLKEKDPLAYTKKLSIEMKKYRGIITTERTNPALSELLKKDLELKEKRNELLEKVKGTTDKKEKEELTAQLKEVIGERFDVIVQKKQLKYEELKEKLEKLQQDVNKSQIDLENYKNNKEDLINQHMDEIVNKGGQFSWR